MARQVLLAREELKCGEKGGSFEGGVFPVKREDGATEYCVSASCDICDSRWYVCKLPRNHIDVYASNWKKNTETGEWEEKCWNNSDMKYTFDHEKHHLWNAEAALNYYSDFYLQGVSRSEHMLKIPGIKSCKRMERKTVMQFFFYFDTRAVKEFNIKAKGYGVKNLEII